MPDRSPGLPSASMSTPAARRNLVRSIASGGTYADTKCSGVVPREFEVGSAGSAPYAMMVLMNLFGLSKLNQVLLTQKALPAITGEWGNITTKLLVDGMDLLWLENTMTTF